MNIVYLNHSGFLVETASKVLVFDYYSKEGHFDFFQPEKYQGKEILFFVSHNHGDHFDARILQWADQASFIFSSDVELGAAFHGESLIVKPHERYTFHGLIIETLLSNDEGVAFVVEGDGAKIYHGGDLNWWHWNGEGKEFNDAIAKSYQEEIARIKGRSFDVAFVPADPRLEDKFSWATDYFMEQVQAKAVFPMHFWGKFEVCEELAARAYGSRIMKITKENEAFSL